MSDVQWIKIKVGMFDGESFKKIKTAKIGGESFRDKLNYRLHFSFRLPFHCMDLSITILRRKIKFISHDLIITCHLI